MQQYYIMRPTGRSAPRTTLSVQLNKDLVPLTMSPSSFLQTSTLFVRKSLYAVIGSALQLRLSMHTRRNTTSSSTADEDQDLQGMIFVARIFDSWITLHKTEPQSSTNLLQPKNLHSVKSTSLDSVRRRYGRL